MSGPLPPGYTSPPPPGAGGPAPVPPPARGGAGWTLASWGSRAGAQLIDGALILGVAIALLIPLGVLSVFGTSPDDEGGILAIIAAVFFTVIASMVVALVYAPLMMSRTNGRTLGRMAVGIRVVRADGRPITFGHAVMREVVIKGAIWLVSAATFGLLWVVDVLWPLWDEENRALHDFLAGTRTVRS